MSSKPRSEWIKLLVKYSGKCVECGKDIKSGEYALWSRSQKSIKHLDCNTLIADTEKKNGNLQIEAIKSKSNNLQFDCYICKRQNVCSHDSISEKDQVCICSSCLEEPDCYINYQEIFSQKMRKIAKVKI